MRLERDAAPDPPFGASPAFLVTAAELPRTGDLVAAFSPRNVADRDAKRAVHGSAGTTCSHTQSMMCVVEPGSAARR
jgi:hypothetical protein